MLEQAAGLSSRALEAIGELEQLVIKADGGRLKLEWGSLRSRGGDRVEDLLWWEAERLVGFLGLYSFGASLELAGMVAPDARGRGIGSALLDAAAPLCRQAGHDRALLIVPRQSAAGRRLALRRGATLDHSEHALVLAGDPHPGAREAALALRRATSADLAVVSRLLELGFGASHADLAGRLEEVDHRIMLVELDGLPVGTISLRLDGADAGIYGFVIDPDRRGRGIGRAALQHACRQLRADGVERIGLEVEVANDRALALYTSVGFEPVSTEDYYAIPLS